MHACLSWSSHATLFLMNALPSCMQTNVSEDYLVTFYSSSFTDHLRGVDIIGEKYFVPTKGALSGKNMDLSCMFPKVAVQMG